MRKTILVVIYAKILDISFIPTIYEHFFYLSRGNESLEIGIPVWFEQLKELKQLFEVLLLDNILINGHFLKNAKYHVRWKLLHVTMEFVHDSHLKWNSYLKCFILNYWTLSIVPALEIKKPIFVDKILWHFDIILHILLIHLLFHKIFLQWLKLYTKWLKFYTSKC